MVGGRREREGKEEKDILRGDGDAEGVRKREEVVSLCGKKGETYWRYRCCS